MSHPDPKIAAEIEAAYAERAAQQPYDEYSDSGPVEEYRVELWPFGRGADKPEVVSVFADHTRDAVYAAAEKLGNTTGLDYTDGFAERAATWQPAPAAEEGRAR